MNTTVQLKAVVARLDSLRDLEFTQEDSGKDCYVFTYGTDVAIFLTEEETMALFRDLNTMVGHKVSVGCG